MFVHEYSFLGKSEEPAWTPPTWEERDLVFYRDVLSKSVTSLSEGGKRALDHYGFIEPLDYASFASFWGILEGHWDVEIRVYTAGDFR